MNTYAIYAIIVPVSYFLGAIPWGYILPKVFRGVDVRQHGSGNTGMANVLRTVGARIAGPVVVLDAGKGALAVGLAWWLSDHSATVETVAATVAVIGHDWSAFLRFKGGRGSAIGLGCTLVIAPYVALINIPIFAAIVLKSRYVSVGSIIGAMAVPVVFAIFAAFGMHSWTYIYFFLIGAAVVVFQHRGNIQRLIKGTERKIGESASRNQHTAEKGA